MKSLHKLITRIEPPNWVLVIIAIMVLFRIPSFFEPYFYGDEMIYLTLGNGIRNGLTLYAQIFDNKPPLIYLTAAIAGNLFWFKAILTFWMIATTMCFWHLVKNLFKENKVAQYVSVIFFTIFTTIPLFEGNIVNAELFLIGPIILGLTILLSKPTNEQSSWLRHRNIFLAGIIFAVGALFKIPAAFDVPVIIVFWFVTLEKINFKNLFEIGKYTFILALGFALPILLTFGFFFLHHAGGEFLKTAFLQNVGYVSSWNNSHGPLLIRAGVVVIGFIILRIFNKKLSKSFLIGSIWLLTSLFAVTLSERPYPHYMIQAVPAIAILIGILVTSVKFEQVLTIIPLTLAIFVPVYFKFYYYSTSAYYIKFVNFAANQTSKWDYFNSFDKTTEGNYKVAQFLMNSSAKDDKIFIWGDTAPIIYSLSRRLPPVKYVAAYHVNDYSSKKEVLNQLKNDLPVFIVIPPNSESFPELQSFAMSEYVSIYEKDGFIIWHLLSN